MSYRRKKKLRKLGKEELCVPLDFKHEDSNRIYVDISGYSGGFASLAEVVSAMGQNIGLYLPKLVRYNIKYRNLARKYGIVRLYEMMVNECPCLKDDKSAFASIKENLESEPIGESDIFLWPIDRQFCVEGIIIPSLKDLQDSVEIKGPAAGYTRNPTFTRTPRKYSSLNAHIIDLSERVPYFDESDYMYDNGRFHNYLISKYAVLSDITLLEYVHLDDPINSCKITEQLSTKYLPIVYYRDGDNYILVARKSIAQSPEAHLLSDKARQCMWNDLVIVDVQGTIFEGKKWVDDFVEAPDTNTAVKIFNLEFKGRWQMDEFHRIKEVSMQSWKERNSMRFFFRQYMDIYIQLRMSKDNISGSNVGMYVNDSDLNKFWYFTMQSTRHGNLLVSSGIAPEHPDSDTEYVFAVFDKEGYIIKPYHCSSPWDYILKEIDHL